MITTTAKLVAITLQRLSAASDDGEEVRSELRKLIERVAFIPLEGLGKFQLEVHGSLAALLALGETGQQKPPQF